MLLKEIIKASATPPSIIYPLFLAPLAIFSLEPSNPLKLIKVILFSATFQSAVNLWNHVNDVEEDRLAGREWVIVRDEGVRRAVAFLAAGLYLVSGLMIYFWKVWKYGIVFFSFALTATWLYSDRMIVGRFIRRLKEHYLTETLTYLVTIPSYILSVWSMLSDDLTKGIAISLVFLFLMLSATLLKDLKDISADKEAGFLTLGVAFHYKTLLKASYLLVFLYYASILLFSFSGVFLQASDISVLPAVFLIYSVWNLSKRTWEIDEDSVKFLRIMIYSTLASLILFATLNLTFA
jgi:1,4-dihydroxy-2-naphthoate octaprenyltransferase